MRKSNENSLKELIDQMIDSYRLRDKLNEVTISQTWEKIMGNAIAKRTSGITIRNKVLHLRITSAPLKQELLFSREKIRDMMNKELGGEFLTEVVID